MDLDSSIAAYRSILAQVIQDHSHDTEIIDKFTFAMGKRDGQLHATSQELVELLHLCAEYSGGLLIVLDGIDECSDSSALVRTLTQIAAAAPVKLLFSSRYQVAPLARSISSPQRLPVDRSLVSKDIRIYLFRRIEEFLEDDLLPPDSECEEIVEHLQKGADGMFLWAKLMVKYLECPAMTPAFRKRVILSVTMPEGLDAVYERILSWIMQGTSVQHNLARRVLMWLLFAYRPLTAAELQQALDACTEPIAQEGDEHISHFNEAVLLACGGLIEPYKTRDPYSHWNLQVDLTIHSEHAQGYRFVHLSVREFLMTAAAAKPKAASNESPEVQGLVPLRADANVEMCRSCVRYLSTSMPHRPLSGRLGERTSETAIQRSFPFLMYAASFWIRHLLEMKNASSYSDTRQQTRYIESSSRLCSDLCRLTTNNLALMAWVEAVYMPYDGRPDFVALLEWARWASSTLLGKTHQTLVADLEDLAAALNSLDTHWSLKLSENSSIIWSEVPAWTPSRFWAKSTEFDIHSLAPQSQRTPGLSSKYLCMTSETSTNASHVAVLSIWSSR
jgi:hypothetical protein